jgi:hypothetical protein
MSSDHQAFAPSTEAIGYRTQGIDPVFVRLRQTGDAAALR